MQIYIKIEYDNGNRVEILRDSLEAGLTALQSQIDEVNAEAERAAQAEIDRKTAVRTPDTEEATQ